MNHHHRKTHCSPEPWQPVHTCELLITHQEPVDWSGKYPLKTHSSNSSPMPCSSIFTDQGNLFINYLDGGPHYLWSTRQNTESWEMHWEGQLWRVAGEHSCVSLHLPETPQTGWFFKDCIQSWESRKIKWGKWPQNLALERVHEQVVINWAHVREGQNQSLQWEKSRSKQVSKPEA